MVKKIMYQKIQQEKKQGKSISAISRSFQMDRKTVSKYYYMKEHEYASYMLNLQERTKVLEPYEEKIIELYEQNEFKKLNMAAVHDYLTEHYEQLPCTEKTVRNYIAYLVEKEKLTLKTQVRMYEKVPELPFGKQMQLDFGQITQNGKKFYILCALLSASRYKYAALSEKPFTAQSLIGYLLDCFDYFGGIPEELVIDQDAIMVVSENAGDIIYTKTFADFKCEQGFGMYVCRKADPESKGKIENMVKFVKSNFFGVRSFSDLETAQRQLAEWLVRRANGRISQATGKIPALLHIEEKKHLKTVRSSVYRKDNTVFRESRIASETSFVSWNGSTYSVPSKYREKEIEVYEAAGVVYFFDRITMGEIAQHPVSLIQGEKIVNRTHFRQRESGIEVLKEKTLGLFDVDKWKEFTTLNFSVFSRYTRDQCIEATKYFKNGADSEKLLRSLSYCIENQTYSFKDLYETYLNLDGMYDRDSGKNRVSNVNIHGRIDVQVAEMKDYTEKLLAGGNL